MVPRSFCLQNEIFKGSVLIYRNQHIFVGIYMAMLNRKQTSIYINIHLYIYDICICTYIIVHNILRQKDIIRYDFTYFASAKCITYYLL